jgi:hypothetical protein
MSRSNRNQQSQSNPIRKIITYRPNTGKYFIYDKDKKENSEVDSLNMIILDADRYSLSGYNQDLQGSITSNMVLNTKKEELSVGVLVKGKYRKITTGLYQTIKGEVVGGKYTRNIFGLVKTGDTYDLGLLQLTGSSMRIFSDWFKDNKTTALEGCVNFSVSEDVYSFEKAKNEFIVVPKDKQKRWLTTWLYKPEFLCDEITKDEDDYALEQDLVLQKFLGVSVEQVEGNTDKKAVEEEEDIDDLVENDLPF